MPAAYTRVGLRHHLLPMLPTRVMRNLFADKDHTHYIVARETVVVHHEDLQGDVFNVDFREVKLERFVEDGDKRVSFYTRFPFLITSSFF